MNKPYFNIYLRVDAEEDLIRIEDLFINKTMYEAVNEDRCKVIVFDKSNKQLRNNLYTRQSKVKDLIKALGNDNVKIRLIASLDHFPLRTDKNEDIISLDQADDLLQRYQEEIRAEQTEKQQKQDAVITKYQDLFNEYFILQDKYGEYNATNDTILKLIECKRIEELTKTMQDIKDIMCLSNAVYDNNKDNDSLID